MARSGAMPDASYLRWSIWLSLNYPTSELRAPDCCTRLDDTLAIAALYRVVARFRTAIPSKMPGQTWSTGPLLWRINGVPSDMACRAH